MANRPMLDVGEGFPPVPIRHYVCTDAGCPAHAKHQAQVHLPERVRTGGTGKQKSYAWAYTLQFIFSGASPGEAEGKANRFILEQFRKEAARTAGIENRRAGRKKQAAEARGETAEHTDGGEG